MRYRIKEYSASVSSTQLVLYIPVPESVMEDIETGTGGILTTTSREYVIESIRLIADETNGGLILASTGQKGVFGNMLKFTDTSIGMVITKSALETAADGDPDDLAAIASLFGTTGTRNDGLTIELDWGDLPDSELLAAFFGLPEALPEIQLATEQEVKGINDDVMGALYGYGMVTVTMHSLMRTGAETTQDLASVIYVDPSKTWAENGFPTLYDDEGTAIDTTTNPAAGDEVFNYQIQSES